MAVRLDRDFVGQIKAELQAEIDREHEGMERGVSPDLYMKMVGKVQGLRRAADIIEDIRKRNDKEDS